MRDRHGMSKTPIYQIWLGMRSRCEKPDNPAFKNYGGRGIKVCDRWQSFRTFYADMGDVPDGMTLERRDNNDGYHPGNCVWDTRKAQSVNRRGLIQITINGETLPLSVWVERIGVVSYRTAHQRIRIGWDATEAITTPKVTKRKCISTSGRISKGAEPLFEGVPLSEAIAASGLNHGTVMWRIKKGWSIKAALTFPARRGPHKGAYAAEQGINLSTEAEAA